MMVPIVRLVAFAALVIAGGWVFWTLIGSAQNATHAIAQRIAPAPPTKPVGAVTPTPVAPRAAPQADPGIAIDRAMLAQGTAADVTKRKAAAWAAFYKQPAACEHPPAWADQVECGNQYMRAKREFEMQWAAREGATPVGGSSVVTVSR
jgi:hypothetical protein